MQPPPRLSRRALTCLFLGILLIGGLALRTPRLDAPFIGLCELDAAIYGQEFRNLLRHGISETRGWPCRLAGDWHPGETRQHHVTHWPMPLWINALFLKAIGTDPRHMPERSLRTVSVAAGTLCPLLLFLILRRITDPLRAGVAAALASTLPATVYFSQAVSCHHALTFLLILTAFLAYFRWREARGASRGALLALLLAASWFSLWEAWYLVPALLAFHTLSGGSRPLRFAGGLLLLATLVGAGLWLHASSLPLEETLKGRALSRSQMPPLALFLARVSMRLLLYNTLAGTALTLLWLYGILRTPGRLLGDPWHLWIGLWLTWACADLILLPDYWQHHAYAVYPFFVVTASASAECLVRLWQGNRRRLAWAAALLLLAQAGWLIQRRYTQNHGYPLTQEFSASARRKLAFGEDLLATFSLDEAHTSFYADALVLGDIHTPDQMEAARRSHPARRFRYLATLTPEGLRTLPGTRRNFQGADLAARLPSVFHERPAFQGEAHTLRIFGLLEGDAAFRTWLDATYARTEDPPFLYYDLDHPTKP